MKNKKTKAVIVTAILIAVLISIPASSSLNDNELINRSEQSISEHMLEKESIFERRILDRNYIIDPEPAPKSLDGDNDDAGTNRDAGNQHDRATPIYPGEIIDNTPGRGRSGTLRYPSDLEDWYLFSVCEGQEISFTMTPDADYNFDLSLWDYNEIERINSTNSGSTTESITFIADLTGLWHVQMLYISGPEVGQYVFDVNINDQNDADTGDDAGDIFADATLITPGLYSGYLDMDDAYDWYKFQVSDGDGVHFTLEMEDITIFSDFDIELYNPNNQMVHKETYYYDDDLEYPIDESGEWRIKIHIFPGWVDCPQPTEWDYYEYGSGAYLLDFSIQSSATPHPDPIPQPEITPIAKTFIINNDHNSNMDEYGYLASIPACNYLNNGERYLAPIVYEGDDTPTNYFETEYDRGTADDTTQYLIDDWNYYLSLYGKTASEYNVPSNPIEAAAEIATENWDSSDLAVIAVDGSGYEDSVRTVISRTRTLRRVVETEEIESDDPALESDLGYVMIIGPKWCAINVSVYGISAPSQASTGSILTNAFPLYINVGSDDWPTPYDIEGDAIDIYNPVTRMGVWAAKSGMMNNFYDHIKITKYAGHRYRMRVRDPDSALNVKIQTDEPSDLLVFLVDPQGHLRAPDIPQWNGPIMPMHQWNGFHNETGFDRWRTWNPEPHTEFSAEVLHPEKGIWTAIVVPRNADGPDVRYSVTGEIRKTSSDRADAAISAANAAVIASQEGVPLLYVNENDVPSETQNALDDLGVERAIFVERGRIGRRVKLKLPTIEADLKTMQEIIDYIKGYDHSENYITITSIKSGDGYFAPASMLAAYHCSPVLRIGDAVQSGIFIKEINPGAMADRIESWRLLAGDYYHGSRAPGHLPVHTEAVEQDQMELLKSMIDFILHPDTAEELPPLGRDAKRYWNEELHNGIHDWIEGYGLDLEGQEAYCFVAPRDDIYIPAHSVMMGDNSYSGHIPGHTPAYSSSIIVRNILYPAIIYSNPNRDITTSQLMNFPDGGNFVDNYGHSHSVYSSRELKKSFNSHFRTYEGHCLWVAHLERLNEGASVFYYSGHGTGGSGISAQYLQTEHCDYPDQIWWDSWRGYSGYSSWRTARRDGGSWYNADPPGLYDIIHYDYVDEFLENLRSNAVFYMSCSTADAFGPLVYLDHGAVCWYGNAGSGASPEADYQDDEFFKESMINGLSIGPAFAKQVKYHFRDFTTCDNISMYGSSSMDCTTVQCIYGDPELIIYSPEWTSPIPVDP